jgi:hypothetical protein
MCRRAVVFVGVGRDGASLAVTTLHPLTNPWVASIRGTGHDAVYFSTNAVLDGPDTRLRSQSRSLALAVGSSYQVTNTVTIPANAPPSY